MFIKYAIENMNLVASTFKKNSICVNQLYGGLVFYINLRPEFSVIIVLQMNFFWVHLNLLNVISENQPSQVKSAPRV